MALLMKYVALALALTTPALANPVPTCDSGACTLENAGIPSTLNNYIGGQFVPPTLGQYATTTSPATGEVLAQVADSTAEDVEKAIAAADNERKDAWNELLEAQA